MSNMETQNRAQPKRWPWVMLAFTALMAVVLLMQIPIGAPGASSLSPGVDGKYQWNEELPTGDTLTFWGESRMSSADGVEITGVSDLPDGEWCTTYSLNGGKELVVTVLSPADWENAKTIMQWIQDGDYSYNAAVSAVELYTSELRAAGYSDGTVSQVHNTMMEMVNEQSNWMNDADWNNAATDHADQSDVTLAEESIQDHGDDEVLWSGEWESSASHEKVKPSRADFGGNV